MGMFSYARCLGYRIKTQSIIYSGFTEILIQFASKAPESIVWWHLILTLFFGQPEFKFTAATLEKVEAPRYSHCESQ